MKVHTNWIWVCSPVFCFTFMHNIWHEHEWHKPYHQNNCAENLWRDACIHKVLPTSSALRWTYTKYSFLLEPNYCMCSEQFHKVGAITRAAVRGTYSCRVYIHTLKYNQAWVLSFDQFHLEKTSSLCGVCSHSKTG